jgi:uncharacterized protein GlcG (DUF336 family)
MAGALTLEAAERVVAACRKRAEEIGQPTCVAVADAGANLVAFVRMDGTPLAAVDGRVVGGVGVSGGSPEEDHAGAAAGAAAL